MSNPYAIPQTSLGVKIYALSAAVFLFTAIVLHLRRQLKLQNRSLHIFYMITLFMGGYFLAVGFFAARGAFLVFEPFPARILLMVFGAMFAALALLFYPGTHDLWRSIALRSIIGLQCFRFLAELLIFWLERENAMPAVMTITGRNYDLLVPISALLIYLWMRNREPGAAARRWLVAWNVVGIAVLLNTVATAILSLPTPRQAFAFDAPLVTPALFPFYLLPVFMVPLALSLHVFALLKLSGYYTLSPQRATASGIR